MAASSSSSSSFVSTEKNYYHVFISFRGEDTRTNFTSHLWAALRHKGIKTYMDEDTLEKGDEISPALFKAIEESKLSAIVLSENYASSSWCLNELNHILRCKEKNNQFVVPIFYHVDPSHVRHQRGSFADAFAAHEERFEMEKMDQWRKALTDVANLSGFHTSITGSKSDAVLVEEIVKDIMGKLDSSLPSNDFKDLFGIEEHIEKMESLLSISSEDIRIVGIQGMGGLGKTTVARTIFNKISFQFQGSKFVENVKEEVKKHQQSDFQIKVFSELLGKNEKVKEVSQLVMDRLRNTKVLLVLDDVDEIDQFQLLAKDREWFGPGSRIIITTRDLQILRNATADKIYEIEKMNTDNALRLFYSKAFKGEPKPNYIELSDKVVAYAKGIPLTLKVLGAHLYLRTTEEWESELEYLKSIPNKKVMDVLVISYKKLSSNAKEIFLDIACFFSGQSKSSIEKLLDHRYSGVVIEIRNLIDKSLLTIIHDNISMHDLLRDMGREIVRAQSINLGSRSRLFAAKDVCHVLENNLGTPEVQGMTIQLSKMVGELTLKPSVFQEMRNLWFLDFFGDRLKYMDSLIPNKYNIDVPKKLQLPDTLMVLRWEIFPLKSLPPKFLPKNLIELRMPYSSLEQLWNCAKHFKKLKLLNLDHSEKLGAPIDLSCAPNLESISLSGCSSIDKVPVFSNPRNIKYLNMGGTSIQEVPQSIECLSSLTELVLDDCKSLNTLPSNIYKLKSLTCLNLFGCSELKYFPEILEPMECLLDLDLSETQIRELHLSIEKLTGLKYLNLTDCERLENIPQTIYNLHLLEYLSVDGCSKLKSLPELPFSIKKFDATGCKSLKVVSNSWIVLTQGPPDDVAEQELLFFDCFELNHGNMMTEFYIRVLCAIVVSLSSRQEFKSNQVPGVGMCFPGKEIPEWFKFQCEGSSKSTELDAGWYNDNFKGFAFCIVFEAQYFGQLICEMCFKTEDGKCHKKTQPCNNDGLFEAEGEHVLMRYSVDVDYSYVSGAVDVSFKFHFKRVGNDRYVVKRCGIHMLYVNDAEKCQVSGSQYLLDESKFVVNEPETSELRYTNGLKHLKNLRDLRPSKSLLTLIDRFSAPNLPELIFQIDKIPVLFSPRFITYLYVSSVAIKEVPSSIECLSHLKTFWLDKCTRIKSLPSNIYKLNSLTSLSLSGCSELECFPEILEPMECLLLLDLSATMIEELHPSIEKLTSLRSLNLSDCKMLKIIPHTIYNLHLLESLFLCSCTELQSLPELPLSVKEFDATGCTSLMVLPNSWTLFTQDPINDISHQEFFFSDCMGLDDVNIVTEFQIRVFSGTVVSLSQGQDLKSKPFPRVGMCFPGAEIPVWFNFKCEGSAVNMKLEAGWYNAYFMGFVLCAIVTMGGTNVPGDLECTMVFKTELDKGLIHYTKTQHRIKVKAVAINEHVVMQSVHMDYCDVSSAVEVLFNFHYEEDESEGWCSDRVQVVRCGVRMLYLQDAMEFRCLNRRESYVEPGPRKRRTIDSDTEKPHQKRIELL